MVPDLNYSLRRLADVIIVSPNGGGDWLGDEDSNPFPGKIVA